MMFNVFIATFIGTIAGMAINPVIGFAISFLGVIFLELDRMSSEDQ